LSCAWFRDEVKALFEYSEDQEENPEEDNETKEKDKQAKKDD